MVPEFDDKRPAIIDGLGYRCHGGGGSEEYDHTEWVRCRSCVD